VTSDQRLVIYGVGAGTGITILFGGGGGCIRQSINFQTAITTRITTKVAIAFLVTRRWSLLLISARLEFLISDEQPSFIGVDEGEHRLDFGSPGHARFLLAAL
jgi:hypothetical protein